jgi:hypothetical protein
VIAEAKEEYGAAGYHSLTNNPLNNQFIASGGIINSGTEEVGLKQEEGVLIWKLDQNII